jgi:translocation and assembly module TamB
VATLNMTPGTQPEPGEVPASGAIDGTYTERNGAVDLRKLELHTPGGELDAHGNLGAYPVTSPTSLAVDFHSRDLRDFDTVLRNLGLERNGKAGVAALPVVLEGDAAFRGTWTGSLVDPHLAGSAQATELSIETVAVAGDKSGQLQWVRWDTVEATGNYSAERIDITQGLLHRGNTEIALQGNLVASSESLAAEPETKRNGARAPAFDDDSTLRMRIHATNVPTDQLLPLTGRKLPLTGAFDTELALDGKIRELTGTGWFELNGGSVAGQPVEKIRVQGSFAGPAVKLASVTINKSAGSIQATGEANFDSRQFKLDSRGSGIDVAQLEFLHRSDAQATGKLSFTLTGSGSLDDPHLNGSAQFGDLALNGQPLGPLAVTVHTADHAAIYDASTQVESASLKMHSRTELSSGYATEAQLEFSQLNIGELLAMAHLESLNGESALAGTATLEGPLARPAELRGDLRLKELAATVAGVHLKSEGGLHATLANAQVSLDPLHVTGEETDLRAQGTLGLKDRQQLDFTASGEINLKLGEMLDPDLTASGITTFRVEGHGPLKDPGLRGSIDFENGSLALEDVPNGLSQLHGTLEFNQDRLEVKSLTAMSGGGQLSVGGYLAYQHGLYADLRVTGKGIRIRYPNGVSSLADGTFQLQGVRNSLLLSGNVLITRFSVSPDLDIAALAAQANSAQPVVSPDAPSNHIRLDIHIVSSPQLNFQNTVAKLAGDVDLRLRGTVASPSLLGSVQITEGNALIAGTRYELQRGTVSFSNPVRIEPSIDLSATAHVSDYDITLGLHGTPSKLSVTYRSDPPLPEADVVALLALGRSGDQQRLYTQQQEEAGANPTTDALLGGALNATVSSRVQKLFGAGSVKIDPNYIGALGNSTSRIIVEEQVGRDLTLTYATNVDTTQQQLLQAEIAINRHVSLLVQRDESGVFSMVVKATRRFR